jgi:hypothetical protein
MPLADRRTATRTHGIEELSLDIFARNQTNDAKRQTPNAKRQTPNAAER